MAVLENENPVLIHPKMANYCRDEVAKLGEVLESENARAETTRLFRKLIDHIVLTPVEGEEGRKSLSIDLHGHLAASCRGRQSEEVAH
jgi:site-specific DNA recombinase